MLHETSSVLCITEKHQLELQIIKEAVERLRVSCSIFPEICQRKVKRHNTPQEESSLILHTGSKISRRHDKKFSFIIQLLEHCVHLYLKGAICKNWQTVKFTLEN